MVGQVTPGGIHCEVRERAGAPTLVLVMGYGGGLASWGEPFLEALAPHARLVLIDNRGTGQSAKPREPEAFAVPLLAQDVLEVLRTLALTDVHLVGYSLGGCIALEAVLAEPTRFQSLALIASIAGGASYVSPGESVLRALAEPAGTTVYEMFVSSWETCLGPERTQRLLPELTRIFEAQSQHLTPRATMRGQLAAYRSFDATNRLADVRLPTLVIHGVEDPLTPVANGEALARGIPGARLALLPETAHDPNVECPAKLAKLLVEFASTSGRSGPA